MLRNVTPARQPLPRGQLLSWVAASAADLRPVHQKAPTGDCWTLLWSFPRQVCPMSVTLTSLSIALATLSGNFKATGEQKIFLDKSLNGGNMPSLCTDLIIAN